MVDDAMDDAMDDGCVVSLEFLYSQKISRRH